MTWQWVLYLWLTLLCAPSEKLKDGVIPYSASEEYAAIKTIHKQLDDNADGNVDLRESAEFVETELCGAPANDEDQVSSGETVCTGSEKSLKFHGMDTEITSTELWVSWHRNEVFNWTNEDVVVWLEMYVELPQYSTAFRENDITGRQLPHLAINAGQILQNSLQITDGQHKQKIQLRAMDIVLFGPPVERGHWKDYIWKISILLAFFLVIYAVRQRRLSKTHMDSFIEDLRKKEEELRKLRSKFEAIERESTDSPSLAPLPSAPGSSKLKVQETTDSPPVPPANSSTCKGREVEERQEEEEEDEEDEVSREPLMMGPIRSSSSSGSEDNAPSVMSCKTCSSQGYPHSVLSQAQESVEVLQQRVWSLEEELDTHRGILQMLQDMLPDCQHKERDQLEFRKSVVEEQMSRAQRACEKIRKRRSSIFGTFHLANSSVLEEAGLQITKAVNKMQAISDHFEEHHKRWNKIGQICGFSVTSPLANSPSSQSPRTTIITQQAIAQLRFNRRSSSFSSQLSEFVYPSSQPYPTPITRFSHLPRNPTGSLPRPPSNLTRTEYVPPSLPSYSELSTDVGGNDSLDSASSTSSATHIASWSKRVADSTCADPVEFLRGEGISGSGSERGSREGSVDIVRPGSGKVHPRRSSLDKKVFSRLDSPDGTGKAKPSPRVSPGVSPRPSPRGSPAAAAAVRRNRMKKTTFSSDV